MVLLHLALGLVLMKSDFLQRIGHQLGIQKSELTKHYLSMLAYHSRIDKQIPDGATVFIGDSITQSLAVSNVAANSFNFGIGSDTTYGVLQRLDTYRHLHRAKTIVLAIGINDLKVRDPEETLLNYERILNKLPKGVNVVISTLHPVDDQLRGRGVNNQRIQQINRGLKILAKASEQRVYTDISSLISGSDGNLKAAYHVGDGIHLTPAGYALWTVALRDAIRELEQNQHRSPN